MPSHVCVYVDSAVRPLAFAAEETLRLRLAYQQDAALLMNANFSSSASVPSSSRRLLAVPAISSANSTTVVSGELSRGTCNADYTAGTVFKRPTTHLVKQC